MFLVSFAIDENAIKIECENLNLVLCSIFCVFLLFYNFGINFYGIDFKRKRFRSIENVIVVVFHKIFTNYI
jgi:hypothetical protein